MQPRIHTRPGACNTPYREQPNGMGRGRAPLDMARFDLGRRNDDATFIVILATWIAGTAIAFGFGLLHALSLLVWIGVTLFAGAVFAAVDWRHVGRVLRGRGR